MFPAVSTVSSISECFSLTVVFLFRYDRFLWLIRKFEENEKRHNTDVEALMNNYYEKFFKPPERFTLNYNTPENFRSGLESRDSPLYPEVDLPEPRIYFDEEDDSAFLPEDYGSGLPKDPEEIFRELKNAHQVYSQGFQEEPELSRKLEEYEEQMRNAARERPSYLDTNDIPREMLTNDVEGVQPAMYTEGGMVYAPNTRNEGNYAKQKRVFLTL